MAIDTAFYLVTRDIAVRSGLHSIRYRIADGRYVLDNKDLSRVRFTSDEYINGLSGVERVDSSVAQNLIAENGFLMGDIVLNRPSTPVDEETEDNQEQTNEGEE